MTESRPLDRDDLRAAQRALGAALLCWPELVNGLGPDRAAARVDAWAARVRQIQEALS